MKQTKKKKTKAKAEYYQNVYVTLNSGTVGVFTGKALVSTKAKSIHVKSIAISEPRVLPKNLSWEGED